MIQHEKSNINGLWKNVQSPKQIAKLSSMLTNKKSICMTTNKKKKKEHINDEKGQNILTNFQI